MTAMVMVLVLVLVTLMMVCCCWLQGDTTRRFILIWRIPLRIIWCCYIFLQFFNSVIVVFFTFFFFVSTWLMVISNELLLLCVCFLKFLFCCFLSHQIILSSFMFGLFDFIMVFFIGWNFKNGFVLNNLKQKKNVFCSFFIIFFVIMNNPFLFFSFY